MFRLETFGQLTLTNEAAPVAGAACQRKSLALLAILAAGGERSTSRDKLQALLWPDAEAEKAGHRLAQALYALRRELGEEILGRTASEPRLDPRVLPSDVADFTEALERGHLERAVGLYAGPFLDGFHLSEAPGFGRWVEEERARFAREYTGALSALASRAERGGDRLEAVEWWRRLAVAEPLSPRVAVGYMEALARIGERPAALQYARVHESLLRQELDVEPDPSVTALSERLRHTEDMARPELAAVGRSTDQNAGVGPRRFAGRYLLERELGQGRRSRTYLARDLRQERSVVVRMMDAKDRDESAGMVVPSEARIVAQLHHSHILPIYDLGVTDSGPYIVTPYIEEGSLRARLRKEQQLPIGAALRIVREVAEALDYAHRSGVIHGNLKPENILLSGGHSFVADCALTAGSEQRGSPQATEGEAAVEVRSDVYALGCVLFEMLAGVAPARNTPGQNPGEVAEPVRVASLRRAVSRDLDDLVDRAIASLPADRFSSMAEFIRALQAEEHEAGPQLAGSASHAFLRRPELPAVAVLPFANLSPDMDNEFFSDGISEELINMLTKVAQLRVASRTSSFAFKGRNQDIREIAEKLQVQTVVEGSVRRIGGRVRVTAQLVSASDGYDLWSEVYDRDLADVFAVQEEIALMIVAKLRGTLLEQSPVAVVKQRPVTPEVYDLYLKGRYFWNKRTPEALQKSARYFEAAIAANPTYAPAHAGLADSLFILGIYGVHWPHDVYPRARAAALRAVELDDTLSEAHAAIARIHLAYDWDWGRAEREFQRALELDPVSGWLHHWFAWLLIAQSRKPEAIAELRRAVELDPLYPPILARSGQVLSYAGEGAESLNLCRRALELDPNYGSAREILGFVQCEQGDFEGGIATLHAAAPLTGSFARYVLPWAYAASGRLEEAAIHYDALNLSLESRRLPPGYSGFWVVSYHAHRGAMDDSFRWLEWMIEERIFSALLLDVPAYRPLRADPRFAQMRRRIGLK